MHYFSTRFGLAEYSAESLQMIDQSPGVYPLGSLRGSKLSQGMNPWL